VSASKIRVERLFMSLVNLVNSIAVTYRASFLSYEAPSVIAFVLSWLATIFCKLSWFWLLFLFCLSDDSRPAAVGRYMFPRHPSLKFEAAKRFVVDDEPLELDPSEPPVNDLELRAIERPLPDLPQLPEAARSRFSF
jgi:hypothetical protein